MLQFCDKKGTVMLDLMDIKIENNNLVVTGKMMGVMVSSIYIKPQDLWGLRKMLSWKIIRSVPLLLLKGWKETEKQE